MSMLNLKIRGQVSKYKRDSTNIIQLEINVSCFF